MPRNASLSLLLLLAALCTWWPACQQSSDPPTNAKPINYTIAVTGMHCDACAASIKAHLEETKGVLGCQVSYEDGLAEIQTTDQTTPKSLTKAIESLGFEAKLRSPS